MSYINNVLSRVGVLLVAMAVVSSFVTIAATAAYAASATSQATVGAAPSRVTADPGYRLGTGDTVHITVFGETDLTGDYSIDGTGDMRMPLIGQIKAAGLTIPDLENAIQAKLASGYLRDPKISAVVTNYRPFYIIGEVNKPGEYPYASGMNVLTAVALAGGFTYRADDTDVDIRHKGSTKEISVPADQTSKIEPGDIITVSERFF
ncbi:MAG: polysaccharide export protein [Pseudomonadota bacterium]|nr:polysaccharide export protein [Pseudomonadota bacterium]